MSESNVTVPSKEMLMHPTLLAVEALGGSGAIGEIVDQVIQQQGVTEAQQALLHLDGPQSELEYRLAWSRTYLKGMSLLTNSSRGVWALTERGQELLGRPSAAGDVQGLVAEFERSRRKPQSGGDTATPGPEEAGNPDAQEAWQDKVLEQLLAMDPSAFERLAKRLLREADFDSVRVTGGTNDKGIDGVGVYRLGLVTFPVFFQCKRYRGSVGSDAVRDFRGAMAGRGDKGLLIVTSTFTAEAKREATREGATPIDLVDGARLCLLLKEYALGVTTRVVEEIDVESGFFAEI